MRGPEGVDAIVECTLREGGKEKPLEKYLRDLRMNPRGEAVVLYGANDRGAVPRGVLHVRDPEELAGVLFGLDRAAA